MSKTDLDMLSHWLQTPVSQQVTRLCAGALGHLQYVVFGDSRGEQAWNRLNLKQSMQTVFSHLSQTPANHLKIYMVPSVFSSPRGFPDSPLLTRTHFNSGMCIHDHDLRTVYIYRNHAIRKVFIHELLHAFDLHPMRESADLKRKTGQIVARLALHYPWLKTYQSSTLFSEAVVEAFACRLAEHYRCKDEAPDFLRWGSRFNPRSNSHALEYVLLKKYVTPLIRNLQVHHLTDAELCALADGVLRQINNDPKEGLDRMVQEKFGFI